jgi:galactoside O-acetyltransferase
MAIAKCKEFDYLQEAKRRFKDNPNVKIGNGICFRSPDTIGDVEKESFLEIGDECLFGQNVSINTYGTGKLTIGRRSIICFNSKIYCRDSITIGEYALISWDLTLYDYEAHPLDPNIRKKQVDYMMLKGNPFCADNLSELSNDDIRFFDTYWQDNNMFPHAPVAIGNNVWIGFGVSIFKGVSIGDNSVIAAKSVVTRPIPANCIAAGIPANVIKKI